METIARVKADQFVTITEGKGITRTRPAPRPTR